MDIRELAGPAAVAAVVGSLVGFAAGRYAGVSGTLAHIEEHGLRAREVAWVDAEGRERMVVGMPSERAKLLFPFVGEGDPMVVLADAEGNPRASFVISPSLLERAGRY